MHYKLLISLTFLFLLIRSMAIAQPKTQVLFPAQKSIMKKPIYTYGSGGLINELTIHSNDVPPIWLAGPKVNISFNHQIYISGYYLWTPTSVVPNTTHSFSDAALRMQQYGLAFGYHFQIHQPIHLFLQGDIGFGQIEQSMGNQELLKTHIWTTKPGIGAELNLTNWSKLQFLLGYRINHSLHTDSTNKNLAEGITFSIGAIFGEFKSY